MKHQFKFSIIMSVYKVEEYLEEAVDSILNQDIGFKDNIQLILVNDGSPDNSETICLRYKDMYPDIFFQELGIEPYYRQIFQIKVLYYKLQMLNHLNST